MAYTHNAGREKIKRTGFALRGKIFFVVQELAFHRAFLWKTDDISGFCNKRCFPFWDRESFPKKSSHWRKLLIYCNFPAQPDGDKHVQF
jgi:hypothetical protein